MKKWLKIGGIAGIVAVVGALAFGAVAFANSGINRTSFGPGGQGFGGPPAEFGMRGGPGGGFGSEAEFGMRGGPGGPGGFGDKIDHDALLAEALGITVEELQAAKEQARAAGLAQAIAEGLITQEEADLMQARANLRSYLDRDALMAKALGLSEEDMQAELDAGKPMPVIIYELGLEPSDVRIAMQAAHEEAIQQAVTDGVITQDQADQLADGPGFGGRHGGKGGPRGGGRHGGW